MADIPSYDRTRVCSVSHLANGPFRMFYLLLALPHIVVLGGLMVFAFRSQVGVSTDEDDEPGGSDGGGGQHVPRGPRPDPGGGGLPLERCDTPTRRLNPGERLTELYPGRSRRDHNPPRPQRAPVPSR